MAVKVEVESKELRKAFPSIRENCCLCGRPTRFWHKHKTRDCALCPDCALTAKTSDIPIKADWCKQEEKRNDKYKTAIIQFTRTPIDPTPRMLKTDAEGYVNIRGVGRVKLEEYFKSAPCIVVAHGIDLERELLDRLTFESI